MSGGHPSAAAGDTQPPKQHFTRAEKRQYAREQAATRGLPPQAPRKPGRPAKPARPSKSIDITKLTPHERDVYIALLEAKAGSGASKAPTLADRVTHDKVKQAKVGEKPKKELSPKKLEKIEKRRQIRAERKAAWLAKKAAEQAEGAPVAGAAGLEDVVAQEKPPTRSASKGSKGSASSRRSSVVAKSPAKSPVKSPAPGSSRRSSTSTRASARSRSVSGKEAELPHPEDDFEDLGY